MDYCYPKEGLSAEDKRSKGTGAGNKWRQQIHFYKDRQRAHAAIRTLKRQIPYAQEHKTAVLAIAWVKIITRISGEVF